MVLYFAEECKQFHGDLFICEMAQNLYTPSIIFYEATPPLSEDYFSQTPSS